jgi:hypothetical protein
MEAVNNEAAHFRAIQLSKFQFAYVLNIAVANNSTLPAFLTIQQDADFKIERITGSCLGPTDANGIRSIDASTDFPLAGTAVPSGPGLGAYADRGLLARITDTGAGRELTSGFIPLETILTPGYGLSKGPDFPFSYYALRNSNFRFDLRNRDTTDDLFHFCSIVLTGYKYDVPFGNPS